MNGTDKNLETAKKIALGVRAEGGRVYFVGGCVRDSLLGIENKDVDIEVHGISANTLEKVLASVGNYMEFGKSFGVYNIKGTSVDIAMPRKETATGRGHRDFKIDIDPFIGTKNAARRRDFTIGALMRDVITGETVDHFGGLSDLENGVIRHVCDESFAEDPLRAFRAAQFAARFGFTIAPETLELCKKMDTSALPRERIFEELKKALLKAQKPSIFFEQIKSMEKLTLHFPELAALIGIEQNPRHHAEGDVWTHTMMVMDEAAKRREEAEDPLSLMLGAMMHDLGKATCTQTIDGVIHAYGHETQGLPLIETAMHRLTDHKALIYRVMNLCENHMKPNTAAQNEYSVKSTNKMFDKAHSPHDLILLAASDGKGKISAYPYFDTEPFLWERLEIYEEYMSRPFVTGKDLIEAGLCPGVFFSEAIDYAHKLRLAGIPKDQALKQTLAYTVKNAKKAGVKICTNKDL